MRLDHLQFPGVYALVFSDCDISGTAFSWRTEVIYVGMTNAKGGLKSRLQQFDNTIKGGDGHGGIPCSVQTPRLRNFGIQAVCVRLPSRVQRRVESAR